MPRIVGAKTYETGPTPERIARASGHASVGDDKMGGTIIQFMDSPLDRVYSKLVKASRTENQIDKLRVEYAALKKYYTLFVESGMVGSIGSVDPNRTYSPSPSGRTFLAGSERQQNIRDEYRAAVIHLNNSPWGHKQTIVVDNLVCSERDLEICGYSVGMDTEAAELILRDAGWQLAKMWGMRK